MQKPLTVIMFSIAESGRTSIYVHRTEEKRGKRIKIKYHPFDMIRGDTKHLLEDISRFVKAYGVEDFDIHHTESEAIFLVQIYRGFPRKDGDAFCLRAYDKVLEHFHRNESVSGGGDDVEAIRNKIESLLKEWVPEEGEDPTFDQLVAVA